MSERACPKCGYEQPDYHTECVHCGIIFAKYSEEADSFLRATQSVPPAPAPRVRPFTLFLLLAYLALGWYAIQYFGIVDELALLQGPEAGIAHGGVTNVRKRDRVNLPAPPALEGETEGDVACFGVPLFDGAEAAAGTDPAAEPLNTLRYETSTPLDDVVAFYNGALGDARIRRVEVPIPEDSPLAGSLGEVRGRTTRWYVRITDAADRSTDVDVVLLTPFFDPSGAFRPTATSITCSVANADDAPPSDAPTAETPAASAPPKVDDTASVTP